MCTLVSGGDEYIASKESEGRSGQGSIDQLDKQNRRKRNRKKQRHWENSEGFDCRGQQK